jgi:hypothetical protein
VPGYVYFIQADIGGPVKIGWAKDPAKRCRDLQTGSPHRLVVRAFIPGTIGDEARLHRQFRSSRLEGEWFTPTAEMEKVAGCKLPRRPHVASPARKRPARVFLCDTCRAREATVIDLRPWATWFADAHLLCDKCPSEGYWFEITRWLDPSEQFKRHLVESKEGGNGCRLAIEERLKQKEPLPSA